MKTSQRKPRSDSALHRLPVAKREAIAEWLVVENVSYQAAVGRVAEQFGVKVSVAAMQRFYGRFARPWRAAQAGAVAGGVVRGAGGEDRGGDAAAAEGAGAGPVNECAADPRVKYG